MAKHSVEINQRGLKMKASRTRAKNGEAPVEEHSRGVSIEDANEHGVVGLEYKPKLSEAVLRAVGLHGGAVPDKDPSGAEAETKESYKRARALHAEEHGADASKRVIRDLRDSEGAIFVPPPEDNDSCTTAADAILLMSHKYGGYFERTPGTDDDGQDFVSARFTYGKTADVVTGSGATTKEAVRAMFAKLGETFACLEPKTAQKRGGDDNE